MTNFGFSIFDFEFPSRCTLCALASVARYLSGESLEQNRTRNHRAIQNQKSKIENRRLGLSMLEAVGATAIVALMLVASLRSTRASVFAQRRAAESAQASLLATALMTEITQLVYQNPTAPVLFGPESGETSRLLYNDVDDYNGLSDSPPANKDGSLLPNLTGWQRNVKVQWVLATDPTTVSASETGAKRITVSVLHNGTLRATRTGVRTNAP